MKRISLLTLFFLCSATLFAQTVKGVLTDEETGEAIPFANVVLDGTRYGAATDINGFFLINKMPEGNYTLRVAYIGYKSIERPLKVTAKNDTIEIGMEMTATVLGMPEVIICGIHNDPIIEIGPEGATNTEIQGVPLKVQY